jgi:hypothetical protein
MSDWAPGGAVNHLIRAAIDGLRGNGLAPSAFLYGEGEKDASIHADAAAYQADFSRMATHICSFSAAPIIVSVETICYFHDPDLVDTDKDTRVLKWIGQEKIEQAQRSIVNVKRGVFAGPDLDFIDSSVGRWDGCHLSTYGLKAAAAQWKLYLPQALSTERR